MEVKELMVGDIVFATLEIYDENTGEESTAEQHPFRITDIAPTNLVWVDGFECAYMGECLDDCKAETFSDIEPIPLTEEILLANGFEISMQGESGYTVYMKRINSRDDLLIDDFMKDYGTLFETSFYRNQLRLKINDLPTNYVHQLQHALRLCGLSDLADNFKIE